MEVRVRNIFLLDTIDIGEVAKADEKVLVLTIIKKKENVRVWVGLLDGAREKVNFDTKDIVSNYVSRVNVASVGCVEEANDANLLAILLRLTVPQDKDVHFIGSP